MICIEPLLPSHVPELSQLATEIFLSTFLPTNAAEPVHNYVEENMSQDAFTKTLADKNYSTLGVFANQKLIGYIQMVVNNDEIYGGTPLELKRFYLHSSQHGRGIAQEMMKACYALSLQLGYKKFWLGVWEKNDRAQSFYKKCGFYRVGAHAFDMGGEIQTDDILLKEL